jgi:hypothetical protein
MGFVDEAPESAITLGAQVSGDVGQDRKVTERGGNRGTRLGRKLYQSDGLILFEKTLPLSEKTGKRRSKHNRTQQPGIYCMGNTVSHIQ